MRSDVNYSHSKNIGEQVGNFCDVPILTYDSFDLELDVELEAQNTVLRNRAMGCSDIPNTAEILPGEVLCSDNIIRRVTTAEATGYDAFKEKQPVKMLVGGNEGALYNAEENAWYIKEKKLRQSTPEEICAWLNNIPKRSFKSRVEYVGDDANVLTTDKAGHLMYAFRYLGGLPGTYLGGDEVRPFNPPQFTVGINSPSRVVQYFDQGNSHKRNPVEVKEYRDEWVNSYASTSHVERMTLGGNALFDELRESIEVMKASTELEIKLAQPQVCEWYPDGETPCLNPITHPRTKTLAGTCDTCYAAREARV